jgi:hypothetical protein
LSEDSNNGPPVKPHDVAPGIYFGMDEDFYHSSTSNGSSDMKRLSYSPPDWWFESKFNPLWEPEKLTPALIIGRARHTMVLEGREKFESLYGRKTLNYATTEGKKQKERFAAEGRTPLDEDAYNRTLVLGEVIRANPFISAAFDGAVGTEVSVFWEHGGLKRKARFDCLKQRAIVDLKNVSNDKSIPFPKACLRHIDNYLAHVQAEHYREGRLAMRELLMAGKVFGDGYDADALEAAVMSPEWAWVWVFAQSSGAPLTWSTMLSYKRSRQWADEDGEIHTDPEQINDIFRLGRVALDRAEKNYKAYFERYGLDKAWLLAEPIVELDVNDLPAWFARNAETLGA